MTDLKLKENLMGLKINWKEIKKIHDTLIFNISKGTDFSRFYFYKSRFERVGRKILAT
jgi:hypothetical protein